MKKVFGIIIIVIISAAIGAGTFSLVIAKRLYFPEVKKVADDTAAGLQLTAYTYLLLAFHSLCKPTYSFNFCLNSFSSQELSAIETMSGSLCLYMIFSSERVSESIFFCFMRVVVYKFLIEIFA